ncbi:MAG: EAL domain-containing protein [Prochlorothrix sp.]|nr:EAL domain-containing protein [Prochlorothrix sp.]
MTFLTRTLLVSRGLPSAWSRALSRSFRQSLSQQLLATMGLILFVVGGTTLGVNYLLYHRNLSRLAQQQAQNVSHGLEFATEGLLNPQNQKVLERVVQNYATLAGVDEITVLSPDGAVLATSAPWPEQKTDYAEFEPVRRAVAIAAQSCREQQIWIRHAFGELEVVQVLPFSSSLFPPQSQRGVTLVTFDPQELQRDAVIVLSQVGSLFVIGSLLALVGIAWGIWHWVLWPLRRLEQGITQSQALGQWIPLPPLPANEIGFLGTTFEAVFRARVASEAEAQQKALRLEKTLATLQETQSQLVATERLAQLSQALRDSEERHRAIVDQSTEGIVLIDRATWRLQDVNAAYCHLTGYDRDRLLASRLDQLLSLTPAQLETILDRMLTTQDPDASCNRCFEGQQQRADGSTLEVEIHVSPIVYSGQRLLCCAIRDITERKAVAARLTYQASHDSLTHLPNRTLFRQCLEEAIQTAMQQHHSVAVYFLDLDRFKAVNDTLGHPVGDQLLKDFANRLRSVLDPSIILARWGGDEFTLLMPKLTHPEQSQDLADQILRSFRPSFWLAGEEFHVTGSLGIALYPQDGVEADILLKNADIALYRAKDSGRNHYNFYSPSIDDRTQELLRLQTDLYHGLERQEFFLCYQPLIDLERAQVYGVEALLRWQHPQLGLVSPDIFIPLAEETGLIDQIGAWVMTTACRQSQTWQEQGLPPFRMAVNLSMRQMAHQPVTALVHQVLEETGLAPQYLTIELTESSFIQDVSVAECCIQELHQLGVKVAMDDFGTGYSSLSYFREFQFDTIKIDRSFVKDLEQDIINVAIVQALVDLVKTTGRDLVVEGVESASQLQLLQNAGCRVMQGYFFCRPQPVDQLTPLLHQWHQTGVPIPVPSVLV